MWTRMLAAFPALLLGCGDDPIATGSATEPDPTSTGDAVPTSDPGTTVAPTTGDPDTSGGVTDSDAGTTDLVVGSTGSSTGDVTGTTTGTTTTDATSTGDTGTGDTSTGDTGDTGGVICGAEGPVIDAHLVHGDEDPGCGTIEFEGQFVGGGDGPVYELDGCTCFAACESPDPWTLTLDVPSAFDLPIFMPECPRIVVQRQMSKQGCELVGVSIWQHDEPPGSLGWWHAGSLLGPIDAIADAWQIEAVPVETCACDGCCSVPTRFDLEFSAAGQTIVVAEGGEDTLVTDSTAHPIRNFQSHHSGLCDASPAIDWIINFAFIPPLVDGWPGAPDMSCRP